MTTSYRQYLNFRAFEFCTKTTRQIWHLTALVSISAWPALASDFDNIFEASSVGEISDIQHYLDLGVDVNARNEDGETPILWAAFAGDLERIQFLLEKGADVNARSHEGDSALSELCMSVGEDSIQGSLKAAKLILASGFRPDAFDRELCETLDRSDIVRILP